jgi:uncharacterized protein (TIGR02145 family)
MKLRTLFSTAVLATYMVFVGQIAEAQVPRLINYQARLVNPGTNLPVEDGTYSIAFSLYDGPTGGIPLWMETQSIQTINGVYSVLLGSMNPIEAALLIGTARYLGVAIGTDPEMVPRKQMVSVPFALHAQSAESVSGALNANNQVVSNVANPVSVQDAATKAYVDALIQQLTVLEQKIVMMGIVMGVEGKDSISDIDNNYYKIIKIGDQYWLNKNLRTTRLNDATAIPLVTDNALWNSRTTPAYCWYNNDEATYKNPYGAIYNWHAVNTGKLCPSGWHVPSTAEWTALINFLGGESVAGGKIKEAGTSHWASPNNAATNETGFTALPGGYRNFGFTGMNTSGPLWSSTELPVGYAYNTGLIYYNGSLAIGYNAVYWGFPVRCVYNPEP